MNTDLITKAATAVVTACILAITVALTIRFIAWIVGGSI